MTVLIELLKKLEDMEFVAQIGTEYNGGEVLKIDLYRVHKDSGERIYRGRYIGQPNECLECLLERVIEKVRR